MKYTFIFVFFSSLSPLLYGQDNDTVKQAKQLGDSLKFIDAISILKTEIKKHPNNADAYYWLGRYSHYLVYDTRPFVQKSDEWSEEEVLGNLKRAIYLNPNLGDAKYFLAVEYSARAREAIQNNHIEQAKNELLEAHKFGGFPDYIIAYSRSILQACDENAILFSNQDASVNAFMYVQLVEGFRKDVSVITINLLERPFYIKYMRDGVPNEITKIPISWSDNLTMNMYGYFPMERAGDKN